MLHLQPEVKVTLFISQLSPGDAALLLSHLGRSRGRVLSRQLDNLPAHGTGHRQVLEELGQAFGGGQEELRKWLRADPGGFARRLNELWPVRPRLSDRTRTGASKALQGTGKALGWTTRAGVTAVGSLARAIRSRLSRKSEP